jgi:hypothetical protein
VVGAVLPFYCESGSLWYEQCYPLIFDFGSLWQEQCNHFMVHCGWSSVTSYMYLGSLWKEQCYHLSLPLVHCGRSSVTT